MTEIEEIRQQTAAARQMVEQKKAEVAEVERQLNESEQNLPQENSQRSIRDTYAGIQGRNKRYNISSIRQAISQKRNEVGDYNQQLKDYEGEVAASEESIRQYDADQAAFKSAQAKYLSGSYIPIDYLEGREQVYYKQLLASEANSEQQLSNEVRQIQAQLPASEKVVVDWKNLSVKGIQSGTLNQLIPLNKYNDKINEYASQQVMTVPSTNVAGVNEMSGLPAKSEINTLTGQPYNVYSKAKPVGFLDYLKEKGRVIRGSLEYVGEKIAGKVDERQQKTGNYYQQEAFQTIPRVATTQAVYAVPIAGEVLMVAGGTEEAIRNPTLKGKALGVAEAGLGAWGLSGAVRSVSAAREIKALESTPLKITGQRIEAGGRGVDILAGYKKIGKSEYLIKIKQPYYQVGNKKMALEGGEGIAYRLNKNKITATRFESGGRVTSIESVPKISRNKITQELKGVQSGAGRVYIKPTSRADLKLSSSSNINRIDASLYGKAKAVKEKAKYSTFIGASRKGEGFFDIISGKAKKARYYPAEDRMTILANPESIGRIRTRSLKSDSLFSSGGSVLKTTKKLSPPIYADELLTQAAKTVAPKVSNLAKPRMPKLITEKAKTLTQSLTSTKQQTVMPVQSQIVEQKQEVKQISLLNINSRSLDKQKTRTYAKSSIDSILEVKSTNKQKPITLGLTLPRLRQAIQQKQQQRSNQTSFSRQDFFMPQKTTSPKVVYVSTASGNNKGKGKVVKVAPDRYLVFVRRYGQDNVVGEATTLEEAKRILRSNLQGTLAASGFISSKSSGSKQDVTDLFGSMFTSSKRDRFRVVQRKGKRLSSRSEVSEIFSLRSTKLGGGKRRPKSLNWW